MFRVRLKRSSVAAFFSFLVLAAAAQPDTRDANPRSGDYIRADVRGQFRKAAVAGEASRARGSFDHPGGMRLRPVVFPALDAVQIT
jgi:hypothetical protein